MCPLEFCFQHAAGPPIGVAEMIVDGRIFGLELDRALELLHRLFVIADPFVKLTEQMIATSAFQLFGDRAERRNAFVESL